jgi:UDPglucose--hexose-1-phosphate uridylyltransferase
MLLAGVGTQGELRKDPTTNRWVVMRDARLSRSSDDHCPFCPGHEDTTPPEIIAYRSNGQPPNSPTWLVRVIPERIPLFQIEGQIRREGLGMFDRVSSRGASEILIEHPKHDASWDTMSSAEIARILWAYRHRVEDLYRDRQIRSILVYRRDRSATSYVRHPFSRILGAPVVFDDIREELKAAHDHYARKQRCLYCDIIHEECHAAQRVIEQTRYFVTYAPYASQHPYETWVVPTTHRHRFEDVSEDEITDLSVTLQTTMRRLHALRPSEPIELVLHTAPNGAMRLRDNEWQTLSEDYHWHIELTPIQPAASAIGGFHVNPVAPETAARALRAMA